MPLTEDKAGELLHKLAQSAEERFKTRLDWEWKARIALWTALVVATGFVLGSETWHPNAADAWWVWRAMIALVAVYGLCFALPVHVLHHEDIRKWRQCESTLAERIWNGANNVPEGAKPLRGRWVWVVLLSVGQFLVTCIFATALWFAVQTRAAYPVQEKQTKFTVTMQQAAPMQVVVEPTGK